MPLPPLLLALVAWLSLVPPAGHADELSLAAAINTAGRQRMLSQKIVKEYCQIGLGLHPAASTSGLDDALTEFGKQLNDLQAVATDARSRQALSQAMATWSQVEKLVSRPVTHDNAAALHDLSEELLFHSNQLVQQLQDRAGSPVGHLVNISGRQRMLSQRLAKLFLLRSWGIDTLSIRDAEANARREFEQALAILHSAPESTAEIARELDKVDLQWTWYRGVLDQYDVTSYQLIMVEASDSILASMETITRLYAQLER